MSKRKRVLIGLGIAVFVVGIYLWLFGFQTMCALTARYYYRQIPQVARTPVALADVSISNVPHRKVSYLGYEFELPWDDIDEQRDKKGGSIHVSAFHSGNTFWFSTFPPKDFVNGLIETAKVDPQRFRQVFGDAAFESDYSFERKMLEITPREITPFVSHKQAATGAMLLVIKAISMPNADSGIFLIRTPDFQGFQFENPQGRPFKITDELYSNDGGIDLIFFQKAGGTAPSISQAEINRIIHSIHRVPLSAWVSEANGHK